MTDANNFTANRPQSPPQTAMPGPSGAPATPATPPTPVADAKLYTARLKRIPDTIPSPQNRSQVFTGADVTAMNQRIRRLTPPRIALSATARTAHVVQPQSTPAPNFYGSDTEAYQRRSKRYLDANGAGAQPRGGAPVFSGSDTARYDTRMLRLSDRTVC
ncbi:hypothetical protein BWQ96_01025 [Gracilariopsis chorda]|uniref:Uncharacterized protein n=1 Tax=Gracilariopsis chorda TaxID=448386 RepID=A0A2V3J452_9FLOR|nr:hypothetical protein BWQ96_01025 [Gracilariopsis chorda]|eukprot:PXF49236.1 hypothetical protein BWQ96_01025 [Gracilariopsis chorda]